MRFSFPHTPRTEVRVALFFLVLPLIFYFNFWYETGFWAVSDALVGGVPYCRLWMESLQSDFSALLWNPYVESGYPYSVDVQAGSFYPLRVLFFLLPFRLAYNYHLLLHFSMGGWFTYLYLRSVGCSRPSAVLGGLAAMFVPTTNMRIVHTSLICSVAWFPLILYFLEKSVTTRNGKFVVLAALACVMQLFGGFFQIVVYSGVFYIVYLLVRIPQESKGQPGAGRRLFGSLALFGLIWGLLVSVVILPTMEISSFVAKEKITYDFFTYMSLHPRALLLYMNPHLLGDITAYTPQTPFHEYGMLFPLYGITTHEHQIYVGIVTFAFAVFSLRYFQADSRIIFWSLVWLVSILFSFGEHFEILSRLVFELPVLGSFRVPARILFLSSYSAIFLFSFAVDRILAMNDADMKRAVRFLGVFCGLSFAVLLLVLLAFQSYAAQQGPRLEHLTWHHPHFPGIRVPVSAVVQYFRFSNPLLYVVPLFLLGQVLCCGILLRRRRLRYLSYGIGLILLADLWCFVYPMNSQWYRPLPHSEIVDFLKRNMSPTDRYHLAMDGEPQYLQIGVDSGLAPNLSVYHRLSGIVGYVTFPKKNYFSGLSHYSCIPGLERYIVDNRFLSILGMKYIVVAAGSDYDNLLHQRSEHYRKAGEFPPFTVFENLHCKERFFLLSEGATILSFDYKAGNATVDVDAEEDSFVVFAENHYPGWSVELDGQPTPLSTDGTLMGASVPKGKHQLRFRYFPSTFKLGLIAFTVGVMLAVASYVYCDRAARRRVAPLSGDSR